MWKTPHLKSIKVRHRYTLLTQRKAALMLQKDSGWSELLSGTRTKLRQSAESFPRTHLACGTMICGNTTNDAMRVYMQTDLGFAAWKFPGKSQSQPGVPNERTIALRTLGLLGGTEPKAWC